MSKLRQHRWEMLKPMFERLQELAKDPENTVLLEGEMLQNPTIVIDDEYMSCGILVDNCFHMIYDDDEERAQTSVSVISKEVRKRVSVVRLENVW